ncbi:fluoride efflux transporter CrcB [Bacillus sp. Bva_UNVM-123]|uniref:fluoride efflux transporter CrcB n=1 Tax=Bacillus sp. Bva_UNVM-123 TaxID=2829798 RepID=UPI00391F497C
MTYLLIGIGGGIGSLLRYFVSILFTHNGSNSFPYSTLCANLVGAFFLGLLMRMAKKYGRSESKLVLAIGTGIIGSFTTMSTFSIETVQFIYFGHYFNAFIYIMLSVFGGIIAAYLGYYHRKEVGEQR